MSHKLPRGMSLLSRPILVSLLVLCLLFPLWLGGTSWYEENLVTKQRSETRDQVIAHGFAFTSAVNRRLARLQGLATYVRIEVGEPYFEQKVGSFVSALIEGSSGVRAMSITPLGGQALNEPGPDASEPAPPSETGRSGLPASDGRIVIDLADPAETRFDETVVTASQSVSVDGQVWGQVSMVIDLSALLSEAGISPSEDRLQLALQDSKGTIFFGDAGVLNSSPVVWPIAMPEGPWLLAGVPLGGWAASVAGPLRVLQVGGFILLSLLVFLAFTVSNRQTTLTRMVEARTAALEEARQVLEERVAERTHQLTRLLAVSAHITSELAIPKLLQLILDQLRQTVPCLAAAILEMEEGALVVVAYQGPAQREQEVGRRFSPEDLGAIWTTIAGRQPCIIHDIREESPAAQAMRRIAASRTPRSFPMPESWLGVPLQLQDRFIGMVAMQHEDAGYFTEERVQLVMSFANHAAIAIENARLYGQAQQLAALQERQKLARELHDSVSQALYGIALGARTARRLLGQNPKQLEEPLDYVLSLAEAGLSEMRSLIFELRPESLEREGLAAALEKQAAYFKARHQLNVTAELQEISSLPLKASEALYRISREALNNIVKHARATKVVLRLKESDGAVTLAIEDDGLGFDPAQEFPGHLGLRSMRERCEQVHGSLHIASRPGRGTCVEATIPAEPAMLEQAFD